MHVHAKVYLDSATLLTTQLYFDEAVTDAVYATDPYTEHTGRDTFNDTHGIFGAATLLTLWRVDDGYRGLLTIGVGSV